MSQESQDIDITQPWRADQPYNQLPLLPPNSDLESRTVLRRCIEARAALGELKHASQLIPDQAMLINTLPILEAQASTEIENIVTTTDRVFQHLDDEGNADPATKEALRYRTGLLEGRESLRQRPSPPRRPSSFAVASRIAK